VNRAAYRQGGFGPTSSKGYFPGGEVPVEATRVARGQLSMREVIPAWPSKGGTGVSSTDASPNSRVVELASAISRRWGQLQLRSSALLRLVSPSQGMPRAWWKF